MFYELLNLSLVYRPFNWCSATELWSQWTLREVFTWAGYLLVCILNISCRPVSKQRFLNNWRRLHYIRGIYNFGTSCLITHLYNLDKPHWSKSCCWNAIGQVSVCKQANTKNVQCHGSLLGSPSSVSFATVCNETVSSSKPSLLRD